MNKALFIALWLACSGLLLACGGGDGGTGVANPPSSTAAAVAALFASTNGSDNAALVIIQFEAQESSDGPCEDDPDCICYQVIHGGFPNGETVSTDPIAMDSFLEPGEYGAVLSGGVTSFLDEEFGEITVLSPRTTIAGDMCTDSEGNENEGLGSDGFGRFASFLLVADITGSCTDSNGTVSVAVMKEGSFGIHRNSLATESQPSYAPQIFGTFLTDDENGIEVPLDCTIWMSAENHEASASQEIDFSACTNPGNNDEPVEQATDLTCTFTSNGEAIN